MKTSEAFWLFLPEGMEELFDLVKVEKTEKSYDLWLDEKKHRSEEDMQNPMWKWSSVQSLLSMRLRCSRRGSPLASALI